jgi:pyrimidine operon attenuation protein/uracil phosphoribosyltransferase
MTDNRKISEKTTVLNEREMDMIVTRMAHEILEKNPDIDDIVLVGIVTRGVPLAKRMAKKIKKAVDVKVPVGEIDPTLYRDDVDQSAVFKEAMKSRIPSDITGKTIVLVDDVMYHGRTARAAMGALIRYGRPDVIQLAALIDRGHRKLPIHPDFVGRTIPTSSKEIVKVRLREIDNTDKVVIFKTEE